MSDTPAPTPPDFKTPGATPPAASPPTSLPTGSGHSAHKVVIRAYPKVIFFWMTWIISLIAGFIEMNGGYQHLGTIWMCVFAFNVVVIAFDFTEVISLLIIAVIALVVFMGLYLEFLKPIGDFFAWLELHMSDRFYFSIFGLFTAIYFFVFLKTRFDYWEFRHNEVIHRRGVFADIKRYSTEDLRWFKEIPDVLERVICGSGRMILTTPREQHPIIIEHVLQISRIDEQVADILGIKRVTMA